MEHTAEKYNKANIEMIDEWFQWRNVKVTNEVSRKGVFISLFMD